MVVQELAEESPCKLTAQGLLSCLRCVERYICSSFHSRTVHFAVPSVRYVLIGEVILFWLGTACTRADAADTVTQNTGESPPEGKLTHVLSFEGEDDLERISATKGMVTRLKASIEVRIKTSRVGKKPAQTFTAYM